MRCCLLLLIAASANAFAPSRIQPVPVARLQMANKNDAAEKLALPKHRAALKVRVKL